MKSKYAVGAVVIIFALAGCKNSAEKLEDALKRYKKGDLKVRKTIHLELLKKHAVTSLPAEGIKLSENMLYSIDGDINIQYPVKKRLSVQSNSSRILFYADKKSSVLSDGISISVKTVSDTDNKEISYSFKAGSSKKPVMAVSVHKNKCIYYRNKQLYIYENKSGKSKLYLKKKFGPPYGKYFKRFSDDYNVRFDKKGPLLGVLSGIAGSYFFSIIDCDRSSKIVRNVITASSKVAYDEHYIYYLKGYSGYWKLSKYNIKSGKVGKICSFRELYDIEIVNDGYVFVNKKGTYISDFQCKQILFPEIYKLKGSVNDHLVVQYKKMMYILRFKSFFSDLKMIDKKNPELMLKSVNKS